MEWSFETPTKAGQIIRTKVSFYYHYGIFVSEDEIIQFGLPTDPQKEAAQIKVLVSDISTFLGGGQVETAVLDANEKRTVRKNADIVKIARSRIGEGGYDILHNNCEHFVNDCAFGKAESSFVNNVREKLRKKLGK